MSLLQSFRITLALVTFLMGAILTCEGVSAQLPGGLKEPDGAVAGQQIRDIAKDPEFMAEITRWLPGHASGAVASDTDDVMHIPEDEIYPREKARIRSCLEETIQPGFFPPGVNANTVGLFGWQKGDAAAVKAEFEWDGAAVTLTAGGGGLFIRLRVPSEKLIDSNPLEEPGRSRLFAIMAHIMRFPYPLPDQVEIQGGARVIRGTTVYTAQLTRRGVDVDQMRLQANQGGIHAFDRVYVFVSDSMPQYISFSISSCGPREDLEEVARMARPYPPFRLRPLPPTPEDFDPDVSKRPRFRNALFRGTPAQGAEFRFDPLWSAEHPGGPIPEEYKQILQRRWANVLRPALLPGNASDIEWRWLDWYGKRAPEQNTICARWNRNGLRVSVLGDSASPCRLNISVRLAGADRLRGLDGSPATDLAEPQAFSAVEQNELQRALTAWFNLPVLAPAGFNVVGKRCVLEEVGVMNGKIHPILAEEEGPRRPPSSDDPSFFLTVSDPQYFVLIVDVPDGN